MQVRAQLFDRGNHCKQGAVYSHRKRINESLLVACFSPRSTHSTQHSQKAAQVSVTGLSLTGEFQGQQEYQPLQSEDTCSHTQRQVTLQCLLPLPSSHNPPNLGTAVRTRKTPRHTQYTLSGQEFCSLPPELFDICPYPLKGSELWWQSHTYDPFFFSACSAYHQYRYVSADFLKP